MTKQRILLSVVVIAAMLFLSACETDDPVSSPDTPNPLILALDDAPISIDPAHSATYYSEYIVVNLYDTLFRYKYLARPYELTPNLAASMPEVSNDGMRYTIKIRQGVRFIDDPVFDEGVGRELTAEDVVYSIKRHFDPETASKGSWLWRDRIEGMAAWKNSGADYDEPVSGLVAVDKYTVVIRLTEPFPQLLHTLSTGFSAIVPKEAVDRYGNELNSRAIGSGPYRLLSFDRAGVKLTRNEQYRQERVDLVQEGMGPHVDAAFGIERIAQKSLPLAESVDIRFASEAHTRWLSLQKGDEIEIATVAPEFFSELLSDTGSDFALNTEFADRFHAIAEPESGFLHFDFNLSRPDIGYNPDPVRNERNRQIRCVINRAANLEELNDKFYGGLGQVFRGVITPSLSEFNGDDNHQPIETSSSIPDGWSGEPLPTIHYGTTSSIQSRQIFELFKSWLIEAGYPEDQIELNMYPSVGALYKAISEGKLTIWFTAWTLDYPDAENALQLFYGPNATPGSNTANFANNEFDRLYDTIANMRPSNERTDLVTRMNDILSQECVTIAGIARSRLHVWHRNIIAYPDRDIVGGYALRFFQQQ